MYKYISCEEPCLEKVMKRAGVRTFRFHVRWTGVKKDDTIQGLKMQSM